MRRRWRQVHRAAVSSFTVMVAIGRARQRLPLDPRTGAGALSEVFGELCAVHGVRTVVSGRVPPEPAILVANHLSYMDPVVLGQKIPCVPISKGEVARWPMIGTAGSALGVLFVDRSDPMSGARALLRARKILEQGASILNFPEGTTTDGSTVLRFRRGIFGLARLTGTPIVPVALRYQSSSLAWTDNQKFLPHYFRTAARPTSTAYLHFCEPIVCGPHDRPEALARVARARIMEIVDTTGATDESAERLRVPPARPEPLLSAASR
jgi:1-acyl-sn-glycerol-3-phosphate acyltransferase